MSIMPWVLCLDAFYNGSEQLDLPSFTHVNRWVEVLKVRPAVQKALKALSEI